MPIDNDPLMAGIDVPNSRTVDLMGSVSQAGNHSHRQHMVPDRRSHRGSWNDQQRRSASAGAERNRHLRDRAALHIENRRRR